MNKYTPGPWKVTGCLVDGFGQYIEPVNNCKWPYDEIARICAMDDLSTTPGAGPANARLIAESPAMLEIIKGFLSNVMAPNPHPQDMDFVCTAAQSLIERVTGEKFQLAPDDKGQTND